MSVANAKLEFAVGVFVLLGLAALSWLSIKLARMEVLGGDTMPLTAQFASVSGLKVGASVEIAGVEVGRVDRITLNKEEFEATVFLHVDPSVPIQGDAIASIRTKGLIGDRYVKISPGASEKLLHAGDRILETESAIHFEELLSQFIHGKVAE